jgi:hypothetical protein
VTHMPNPVTLIPSAVTRDVAPVTPLPDDVTHLIRIAYVHAAGHVATLHGVSLTEVTASPDLREAVLEEFTTSLPYRREAATTLATAMMPRTCAREACGKHVPERARWCSSACRQWGARQRRKAA